MSAHPREFVWRLIVFLHSKCGAKTWVSKDIRTSAPGWGEQYFEHPISRLTLALPDCRMLILEGMQSYNFAAEGRVVLGSDRVSPVALHFFGQLPGGSDVSRWTLNRLGFKHDMVHLGAEYMGSRISGWKDGHVGGKVVSRIVRVP